MTLAQILAALAALENGAELKQWLQNFIADKDKAVTDAESANNTANKRLSTIAKELGTDDAGIEESLRKIKGEAKELETATKQIDTLKGKVSTLEGTIKESARKETVASFASVVGADKDVLFDLLPSDAELTIAEIDNEGTKTKVGKIKIDGKDIDFVEHVSADPRLSRYKESIFTQQQNPPKTPPKMPTGKGNDTQNNPIGDTAKTIVTNNSKNRLDKINQRFGK